MLKRIRERMNRDEGFTLIELMVVVLIIAILIAIAIPTFLGARERAQDRAAQSSLRNALTAAKTIFTDNEDYQEADQTALAAAEPSLTFVGTAEPSTTASADPTEVSIGDLAQSRWAAVALSNSGTCFAIQDQTTGPGTEFQSWDSGTTACSGDQIPAAGDGSWADSW